MENVIKDIEENCKDKSIKGIVKYLFQEGDLSYNSEHFREIWHFYKLALKTFGSHREAKKITIFFMKINNSKFKRIIRRFKRPLK